MKCQCGFYDVSKQHRCMGAPQMGRKMAKTYKVIVKTEHEYSEEDLLMWMKHCTDHPDVAWEFSDSMQHELLQGRGRTILVKDDDLGRTFVQSKRIN